jgi:hypothetical protein
MKTRTKRILQFTAILTLCLILGLGVTCFTVIRRETNRGIEVRREFFRKEEKFLTITDKPLSTLRVNPLAFRSLEEMSTAGGLLSSNDLAFLNSIDAHFYPPDKNATSNTIVFAFPGYYVVSPSEKVFVGYVARSLDGGLSYLEPKEMQKAGLLPSKNEK